MSQGQKSLETLLKARGYQFQPEYRFAAELVGLGKGLRARLAKAGLKDWRFDIAFPELKVAVEIEGGGWVAGRHNRGKGFSEDLRKYDAAMRLGWLVYRCDTAMAMNGHALQTIEMIIKERSWDAA